jgi:hypothetical protein
MDEHLAQISVAELADAEQLRLATSRVLPWDEAEPRREVSPLAKCCAVTDGGDDRCRNDRTDTRYLPDATAACVVLCDLFKPVGQLVDLPFDGLPLFRSGYRSGCASSASARYLRSREHRPSRPSVVSG